MLLSVCALTIGVSTTVGCANNNEKETIAIVKLGSHTSLNDIEKAIVAEFDEKLDKTQFKYKLYDCSFNDDLIAQTITGLKSRKIKAIIPIATPVATVAASSFSDIPIVFSAVSDPIGAGLVTSLEKPTGNITGTSDEIQISSLIDKAIEVNPQLKTIGYIYNAAEQNSITNKKKIDSYCKEKGISIIEKTIANSSEITEIANSIVGSIDALIVTDDNTVANGMTALSVVTRKAKIPTYCGVDSEVRDGGMLSVGINYTTLGTYTANMVLDIINGTPISNLPVKVFKDNLITMLNEDYITATNITLPSSIINDASLIKVKDSTK